MPKPSNTAKITHNLGLATWFGGSLFGQIALNPTVDSISDKSERGRVTNEGWARFNAVELPAIAATLASWRFGGLRDDAEIRAPGLTRLKDVLLGGAAFNGVMSGILGARLASQAASGQVPIQSGLKPSRDTPPEAAASQRWIAFFGTGATTLSALVIAISGVIETQKPKPRGVISKIFTS
ncbi:hypothetical protein GBA65_18545 [Rubrobacter marinus]|uniref:Uncharacterized protein n=1 Tax=Rubrobacter marinus TaxID=2653852 RepID=A0A6G8Q160_9ACTN|nr:hypothetical protein [Rubrobacter marinus]QIN80185.1 hypothetical protein GBA65_18545 [Rubrobacter marinus]